MTGFVGPLGAKPHAANAPQARHAENHRSLLGSCSRAGWIATLGSVLIPARLPTPLHAAWVDQQVQGPFVCHVEASLAEMPSLVGTLGQLQDDLVQILGIPPAHQPIDVFIFQSKKSYDRFLDQNGPKAPYRRALFVQERGRGRVFTYRGPQLATDLRHECTHALLHAVHPVVPLWLDEGLAVYFEVPPQERPYHRAHLSSVRWLARFQALPSLSRLEKLRKVEQMDRGDYRAAWAWVHFLLNGPQPLRHELSRYLADIRSGGPPGQLSQRLANSLTNPTEQLARHFLHWPEPPVPMTEAWHRGLFPEGFGLVHTARGDLTHGKPTNVPWLTYLAEPGWDNPRSLVSRSLGIRPIWDFG